VAADRYHIVDEPLPGPLERFVTDPIWPLFGMMFGGAWLGLPWFVFNGIALGSASLRREIAWAVAALVGAAALVIGGNALVEHEVVTTSGIPYLVLLPLVWKLGVGYHLLNIQRRSFALWEHYGGQPRRAFIILLLAFFLRQRLAAALDDVFLLLVLL
jgi:hypothetical protein